MKVYVCSHCNAESFNEEDEGRKCVICNKGEYEEYELSKSERDEIARDVQGDEGYDEERGK